MRALGLEGVKEERPCWCERWEGAPVSASLPPQMWSGRFSQPPGLDQQELGGEADRGALKDELQPHGCRLIIFPTHLIDGTHGALGTGLHWAHCRPWGKRGNDRSGSSGGPSLRDVAWGQRGQWGLLLSPFCLLPPPGVCFFSLVGQHVSGGNT